MSATPRPADTAAPIEALAHEVHLRALRHSLWLGLVHAQRLGLTDLQTQLTTMLVGIDGALAALDAEACG